MAGSSVYIAGVGVSYLHGDVSSTNVQKFTVSAGTKALLDAGLTYNDIDQTFACSLGDDLKVPKSSFDSFGKTGSPVTEVDGYTGLFTASQPVKGGQSDCVLMVGFDEGKIAGVGVNADKHQIAVVAVILASPKFLSSHAYLKDSSISICGSNVTSSIYSRTYGSNSEMLAVKTAIKNALHQASSSANDVCVITPRAGIDPTVQEALKKLGTDEDRQVTFKSQVRPQSFRGNTGLLELCEIVWGLRGWGRDSLVSGLKRVLQYSMQPEGTAYAMVLGRADEGAIPEWKIMEYLRDGRERIGCNPVFQSKDITFEDWLAVKARDEYVPDQTAEQLGLPVKGGDRAALARL